MENTPDGTSPRTYALNHLRPRHHFFGCSRIADYELQGKLGEGTFGYACDSRRNRLCCRVLTLPLIAARCIAHAPRRPAPMLRSRKSSCITRRTVYVQTRPRPIGNQLSRPLPLANDRPSQFPITALREIKLMKLLSHENVLRLEDMAVEHPTNQKSSTFLSGPILPLNRICPG